MTRLIAYFKDLNISGTKRKIDIIVNSIHLLLYTGIQTTGLCFKMERKIQKKREKEKKRKKKYFVFKKNTKCG